MFWIFFKPLNIFIGVDLDIFLNTLNFFIVLDIVATEIHFHWG